jgi:hypothetical protein
VKRRTQFLQQSFEKSKITLTKFYIWDACNSRKGSNSIGLQLESPGAGILLTQFAASHNFPGVDTNVDSFLSLSLRISLICFALRQLPFLISWPGSVSTNSSSHISHCQHPFGIQPRQSTGGNSMNRFVKFTAGLLLMCSMTGCCLMHGMGYGAGYGGGYPGGGGCGSCGGGCGVSPGGYPSAFAAGGPQQAFAPNMMMPQTAYAGYPTMMAMDPLPTIIR